MVQTQITFGEAARDRGIKKAVDHANQVHDKWSEQAYTALGYFLQCYSLPFMVENFRQWCYDRNLIPEPPSKRAFGGVIRRAAYDGLIRKVSIGHVKNEKAHACFASVWQRV